MGVLGENYHLILYLVTGIFRTSPSRDSNPSSDERQLAVSDNALDHSAIWQALTTLSQLIDTLYRRSCGKVFLE